MQAAPGPVPVEVFGRAPLKAAHGRFFYALAQKGTAGGRRKERTGRHKGACRLSVWGAARQRRVPPYFISPQKSRMGRSFSRSDRSKDWERA